MTSPWPTVVCIAVVALTGSALILLVPHLFNSSGAGPWIAAIGLGIMAVVFAIAGRRLRPSPEGIEK